MNSSPLSFLADESCDFSVIRALRSVAYSVKAVAEISPSLPDEMVLELVVAENRKDAPVLAAALQGKVDIFVTGDRRDFGYLFGRVLQGVKILTPADALEAVSS